MNDAHMHHCWVCQTQHVHLLSGCPIYCLTIVIQYIEIEYLLFSNTGKPCYFERRTLGCTVRNNHRKDPFTLDDKIHVSVVMNGCSTHSWRQTKMGCMVTNVAIHTWRQEKSLTTQNLNVVVVKCEMALRQPRRHYDTCKTCSFTSGSFVLFYGFYSFN